MSHLQPWWWLHNISWIKAAVIRQSIHRFEFVIPEALEKPQKHRKNGMVSFHMFKSTHAGNPEELPNSTHFTSLLFTV